MCTPPVTAEPSKPDAITRLTAGAAQILLSLPPAVLRVLGVKKNQAGNRLDSDVLASLRLLDIVHGEDFADLPPQAGREIIDKEAHLGAGKMLRVGSVVDYQVNGVPIRHYRPEGAKSNEPLPTVIWLHGGGWVLGSLTSHESTCRWFCNRARVAVLAVDYRLAPEHRFPAGLDDVTTVVKAVLTHGAIPGVDADRVVVAGDSAGGNLSAAVCLRLRDEGLPQPRMQMLFVPVTNLEKMDTPSHGEFADGFFLTRKHMEWYREHYVPNLEERRNSYVSPLLARDLSGVAPAYVAVAGFDPLRDEGEAYARRLAEAGVKVTLRRHEGLVHPFVNSTGVWAGARRAMDEAVGALRFALSI